MLYSQKENIFSQERCYKSMNPYNFSRILLILTVTTFLLTACNTKTTDVADQKGKSVTVSSQDSKTYSFKLEPVSVETITPKLPEVEEAVPEAVPEAAPQEEAIPEIMEEVAESEPEIILLEESPVPIIGPKTGEP